jgi:hypothetical protein
MTKFLQSDKTQLLRKDAELEEIIHIALTLPIGYFSSIDPVDEKSELSSGRSMVSSSSLKPPLKSFLFRPTWIVTSSVPRLLGAC